MKTKVKYTGIKQIKRKLERRKQLIEDIKLGLMLAAFGLAILTIVFLRLLYFI